MKLSLLLLAIFALVSLPVMAEENEVPSNEETSASGGKINAADSAEANVEQEQWHKDKTSRETKLQAKLDAAIEQFTKATKTSYTFTQRISFADNATKAALKIIPELTSQAKPELEESLVKEFLEGLKYRITTEMVAVAYGALQLVHCTRSREEDSVSRHMFKAASAIYLVSLIMYKRNYLKNVEEMNAEHVGNEDEVNSVLAMKAGVHNEDEKIAFTDKVIKARQLFTDMIRWSKLAAELEYNIKYAKINQARGKKDHHKKEYDRYRKIPSSAAQAKAYREKKKYEEWKEKLEIAKVWTHLTCGNDDSVKNVPPKSSSFWNPLLETIFPTAFAAEKENPLALWQYYLGIRNQNAQEVKNSMTTPDGRKSYLIDLGTRSGGGIDLLRTAQSESWDKRTALNGLYVAMKNRLKLTSKFKDKNGKVVKNSDKHKYYDLNVNGQTGCPTCEFNPLEVAFGDSTGGGLLLSSHPKGNNALAKNFRDQSKALGIDAEKLKGVALNANDDGKMAEDPYKGTYTNAFERNKKDFEGREGFADFFAKGFMQGPQDPGQAVANTDKEKDKEGQEKIKMLGALENNDEKMSAPKLALKIAKGKDEPAKMDDEGITEIETPDEQSGDIEDINENRGLSLWVIISNRYIKSGIPRLAKRKDPDTF